MRIAHLSDLHFTSDPRRIPARYLVGKRLIGWANLRLFGRFARFRDAAQVVRAALRDLDALRPDGVVISGDLTGMGLASEYDQARSVLAPLLRRPKVVAIPGNHDIYVERALRDRPFARSFAPWLRTDRPDLQGPGGFPRVVRLGPGVFSVSVSAARPTAPWDSSGRLGPRQLDALDRALADPALSGQRTLLVVHYGPRRPDGSPDSRRHGLRDAEAFLALARRHGVAAILHGHLHRRFILPRGQGIPVPLLCAGSLTDARRKRSYHLLHLEAGALSVEVRAYDAAADRFRAVGDRVELGVPPGGSAGAGKG